MEREVPISDRLVTILKTQKLGGLSRSVVFPVTEGDNKGERFAEFPKYGWIVLLKRATERAQKAAKDAGLPSPRPITGGPHKARHTFASHFLAASPDLFLLGKVLGHTHTRVTELYSHLVPGHLDRARNAATFDPAAPVIGKAKTKTS